MKYEYYLEKVQQTYSDEFDDIGSILNRHKLLVQANTNLEENNKQLEDKSERLRLSIDKYQKEKLQEKL